MSHSLIFEPQEAAILTDHLNRLVRETAEEIAIEVIANGNQEEWLLSHGFTTEGLQNYFEEEGVPYA
jgi:hypothetical protein